MPRVPLWIFLLLALLYFSAVRVDIMDIDASQYAEISREMAHTGDYLHIYDRGRNYLDKPPFLFWAGAAGIKLFGATNLGYKLPSILMALLALYATYRLTRLLYDEATGRVAALILGCCQGMFLMTNDIRCDLVLMSWTITAIWLIQEWVLSRRLYWLLAGSAAIAFGMLSKGPIALLTPVFALGSNWVLHRQWRLLFRPEYLLSLLVIAVLLVPFSIGLYQQYDLYPSKFIDGKTHVSGIEFFFWTQSFGRITGESSWNNGADLSFQLVNMLWSFLPWMFLLLPALWINVRQLVQQKFRLREGQEWLSTGGFLLSYLAVGLSKYQLPHYIFVAFPLPAIMCAALIRDLYQRQAYPRLNKILQTIMSVAGILLFTGVLLILLLVFPSSWYWLAACAIAITIWFVLLLRKNLAGKTLWLGAAAMLLVNIFLTHRFYYELMHYQVGAVAGKYIREHNIPTEKVISYRMHDPLNSLHFYADRVIRIFEKGYVPSVAGDYILTQDDGLEELNSRGFRLEQVLHNRLFKVSELTGGFISSNTRIAATHPYYLVRVLAPGQALP